MTDSLYAQILDGLSGYPLGPQPGNLAPGTVEHLLDAVERHATAEQDALAQYEYLQSASGDPVVALAMGIILEDEERHHGLLKRIEATLRDALDWTHSPEALPAPTAPAQRVTKTMVDTAGALIKEEHNGARALRDLAHREKDVGYSLQGVLIEMMALDSEKHARLLEFVHDRLERRARSQP